MRIEIQGYKNLENLQMEIDEKKINIIFGISGSGKSSISNALQKIDMERNVTIGFENQPIIRVNGTEEYFNVKSFSREAIDNFIVVRDMGEIQTVLVEDPRKLRKIENELRAQIRDLELVLNNSSEQYSFLSLLKSSLGSNLTKSGNLRVTSRIIGLEKSFQKVNSKKIWDKIIDMPEGKFVWIKQGGKFMDSGICPFCERRIPKKQLATIEKTDEFEQKAIDSILDIQHSPRNTLVTDRSFSKDGIGQLKDDVIEGILALKNYDEIVDFLNALKDHDLPDSQTFVEATEPLQRFFPDVYEALKTVNEKIERLKRISESQKRKTKQILARRLDKINRYLGEFSMPFIIEAEYANGRIKTYKISYIKDIEKKDRVYGLSEGEKCILAQLMFIFQCKNENSELIIIDDPASAFDDYRRNQILNVIKKELDGRTVLIMSHDSIYAKYGIADNKKIGRILFIENFGVHATLREISKDDFGEFNDFVLNRIENTNDYYQKIINLRLLYEGNHRTYAYKYLSGIIHHISQEEMSRQLELIEQTEESIIRLIKKKYPELSEVDIPTYSEDFQPNISSYSILEKAFWIRENFRGNDDKIIQELNDFAHINRYLKICLNPYEFNYCTSSLYKYVTETALEIR